MKRSYLVGAAALTAGLLLAAAALVKPAKGQWRLRAFAQLPILEGGRVKPIDSLARNSLLVICGKQTLRVGKQRLEASRWLLDVMFKAEAADTYNLFLIDDPDVLGLLGIEKGAQRRFAYWQLEPRRQEIQSQAESAGALKAPQRSRFQSAVLTLNQRLALYERLKNTIAVAGAEDPLAEASDIGRLLPSAMAAIHSQGRFNEKKMAVIFDLLERYRFLAAASAFKALAPTSGQDADSWRSIGEWALSPDGAANPHPAWLSYARLAKAYKHADSAAFNAAVKEIEDWFGRERPAEAASARYEEIFNRAQPFVAGMTLYILALLALFAWWATGRRDAQWAALGFLCAAALVHTAGLGARVILQGRPPVTNLYSSAVFVGWVGALLGLACEKFHNKGLAAGGGAVVGFCTLLVAQHLGASGDTMEMMRAVLDSNFWLATHVVTITIGYGSTFLAGALGLAWIAYRFWSGKDKEVLKALVSAAYGLIAFSLFFSFLGTVLGGIWADQSWGRFWGWDPKENGALLIVLWNAVILHARWSGVARERGVMVMAVLGNVVTAFSWFGVNMLGVGLHSYGFMERGFWWLLAFSAVHLAAAGGAWAKPLYLEPRTR